MSYTIRAAIAVIGSAVIMSLACLYGVDQDGRTDGARQAAAGAPAAAERPDEFAAAR